MLYRKYVNSKSIHSTTLKHKHNKLIFIFWMVTLITASIILYGDYYIRPILNRAVSYQTKLITTDVISNTTFLAIEQLGVSYDDIVHLTYGQNNCVTSIQTNAVVTNKIKSSILKQLTHELNSIKNFTYFIPLGTVIGNDYFIDRGPNLSFKLSPMGFASGELISKLESVGINQTHHQIILQLDVEITTLIPMHNSNTRVNTNFLIAETVIVGSVPQQFTDVL